jgi:hypothetical protein
MSNKLRKIPPEFVFIRLETTQYWKEEFLKKHKIKKVFDIHLYNQAEKTYCCEITPSYELNYVQTDAELEEGVEDDVAEAAHDAVMAESGNNELVSYYHIWAIEAMGDECKDKDNPLDDDAEWETDEQYLALLNEWVGEYSANPSL